MTPFRRLRHSPFARTAALAALLGAAACESGAEAESTAPLGPEPDGVTDGTGGTDGSAVADGADATDATDAADGADGTTVVVDGATPSQSAVSARVSGRTGSDVTIALIVEDTDKDAAGVRVRALDAAGQDIAAFKGGLDDTIDSSEARVPFDTASAKPSFAATVTLRGFATQSPEVTRLEVAVFDAAGHEAVAETVDVVPQPEVALGEACDPDAVENRCEAGFGCRGTPSVCSEGLAPEIGKAAYLVDGQGVRILVAGTDPEDDVATVEIAFLDAKGQPVELDLDGDESADSTSFAVDASGSGADGEYFVAITPSGAFSESVAQVAITPSDAAGHVGASKTVKQSKPATKGSGAACDPRGFDQCAATSVCALNAGGTAHQCQARTTVQARRCDAAPVVTVVDGVQAMSGIASGSSAWDAPLGCAASDPVNRPEGLVVLRLDKAYAHLRLNTAVAGTTFDTVLYVFDACGEATATVMACSDDSSDGQTVSGAGAVELEMVGPGDLAVVVDSWGPEGGAYTLEIQAE